MGGLTTENNATNANPIRIKIVVDRSSKNLSQRRGPRRGRSDKSRRLRAFDLDIDLFRAIIRSYGARGGQTTAPATGFTQQVRQSHLCRAAQADE